MVENPLASAGDERYVGSIPGQRRSPGGGNDNLPQYPCQENFTDRGAWWATAHGVAKELDFTEHLSTSHKLTLVKHTFQRFVAYSELYIHRHHQILEPVNHPLKKPFTHQQSLTISHPPFPVINLLSVSTNDLSQTFDMNGGIQYVAFCDQLLLLSTIFLKNPCFSTSLFL